MTNAEKLRRILKETFPNVIFIWGFSEERKEVSIHMSTNWLEDSYTEKEQDPCEDGMWSLKNAADALKRHGLLQRQEPCEDAISRQAVIRMLNTMDRYVADELTLCDSNKTFPQNEVFIVDDVYEQLEEIPSVTPELKMKQFAEWVAEEIFDDNWEYNKDAFAELACRKLAKLGIVRAKGNEWELVEPQESED